MAAPRLQASTSRKPVKLPRCCKTSDLFFLFFFPEGENNLLFDKNDSLRSKFGLKNPLAAGKRDICVRGHYLSLQIDCHRFPVRTRKIAVKKLQVGSGIFIEWEVKLLVK